LVTTFIVPVQNFAQAVIELGDRRELFVDHYIIDRLTNLKFTLHAPHNEGPVLYFDKPWEGHFSGYCTIIHDREIYRAYYRGIRDAGVDGSENEVTCYAESKDGIHWQKPDLNLFEINGSKNNNVILAQAAPVNHNFSPFLDQNPNTNAQQRYKALGGTKESGLIAFTSPDGIHWKKIREEPVITEGAFDSQNVSYWSESEQKYVCYFRTWFQGDDTRFRSVSRATSEDFIHWSNTVPMMFGDTPQEHIYTQQTSPYYRAPHIYLAIGARFMKGRQVISEKQAELLEVNPKYYQDCSDAILMTSRGGNKYDRTFLESFIRPGIGLQNWVSRSNYPALNIVQTGPEEMSIYVNENYAQPSAHLKRYSMRIDGISSLSANFYGGELLTKPFIFQGNHLEINYATSAAGSIKIEILDHLGKTIPGYNMDETTEIIGNEIKRIVQWKEQSDISKLAGRPIRLRIVMKDANLYAFKFSK
jgi:hypothetical protein